MEPFQERMVAEVEDLTIKLGKLVAFMELPKFNQLQTIEQKLLLMQLVGMELYLDALKQRLEHYAVR